MGATFTLATHGTQADWDQRRPSNAKPLLYNGRKPKNPYEVELVRKQLQRRDAENEPQHVRI